jgi:hypothetical protein
MSCARSRREIRGLVETGVPRWFALAMLAASLAFSVACDPGHEITFRNGTGTAVTIYFEGRPQGSVDPGGAKVFTHLEYSGAHTWEAKDEQGYVVYHASLRWADIRALNWTITITGATNSRQQGLSKSVSDRA